MLEQGLIMEGVGAVSQVIFALLINKIGKFPITCEFEDPYLIYLHHQIDALIIFFNDNFRSQTVFILTVSGFGGIVTQLTDLPLAQVYGFNALMLSALAVNVFNSVAVELYPTTLR